MPTGNFLEIGGILFRKPGDSYHGTFMPYYEPVMSYTPIEENRLTNIYKNFVDKFPVRVDLPLDSVVGNCEFDYHEICIKDWPNISPLGRYGSQFRKLTEQLKDVPFEIVEIDPLTYSRDTFDFETDLALSAWGVASKYLRLKHANTTADFRIYKFTHLGQEAVCSVSLKSNGMLASAATWLLCKWLAEKGVAYFDMWNLSLTERESYKKLFFTSRVKRKCWYNNSMLPEWMTRIEDYT